MRTNDPVTVRCEWGPVGAEAVVEGADVAVVVDVLSFTTTVTVAADRGIAVVPCPVRDDGRVRDLAHEHGAVAALPRARSGDGFSLSPSSFRCADPVASVVLPSPNGSTISALLARRGIPVVAASLRNRRAVASWLWAREPRVGTVAVVAAGEHWPDGSPRFAVEDLWGAGAVVAALADDPAAPSGPSPSPEARAVAAAFRDVVDDLPGALHACHGGRELTDLGYAGDVDVAAELDGSTGVPRLVDGVFRA